MVVAQKSVVVAHEPLCNLAPHLLSLRTQSTDSSPHIWVISPLAMQDYQEGMLSEEFLAVRLPGGFSRTACMVALDITP